ncbi:glycosyltransferase [Dactylosporangium sp. NPDC049525]|uniref:MGDG synthase family glycosyltransferase n=1 Tax=Dactylosporangium sp. NPDC049525 TaxID=3154730 RepID=UPI003427D1EF
MEHQPAPHGRRRIVIISASFGAGHDGAAAELARRLSNDGHRVDRHDLVDLVPRRAGVLLRGLYRRQLTTVPRTWGWLLALAGSHRLAGTTTALTASADDMTLEAIGSGAAAVVSTYPLAGQVLGRLRRQGRLAAPVITYLTDLSVHPLWIADGVDVHLALHDDAARQAKELGATDVRVVAPAVAPAFTGLVPADTLSAARRRWGLPAAPLALVVAGAWGVGSVERAAEEIAATGLAVPVVACGRNDTLRRRLNRSGRTIALGWVDDMATLVRACQVVVQNAGGLSSLEALAAGVPVVTYRCLPGHGATNAEALDRIGWVPWIRHRGDLDAGLRAAFDRPRGFNPAAALPEAVLAAAHLAAA